jgi:toxin ParE1/3/4
MKHRIVVLPRAKQDAREIDSYLAERNPAAADRFSQNLEETVNRHAAVPTPGMPWLSEDPELADLRWTRVHGFENYLVFFCVRGGNLEVVRVLHGARDIGSILGT